MIAPPWVDRVLIANVSPRWAEKRQLARLRLMALYEAGEASRLHKARRDASSANARNNRSIKQLREAARYFEQNLDIASGALDVLVSNVIGSGIQPEPQVMLTSGEPAEELNRALLKLWDDWIHTPDVTHEHDYYSLQRLCARTWFRDGEQFTQRLIGNVPLLDHGTIVPYSLEALEPDFVPLDLNDIPNRTVQGIELNVWNRPRFYHVYLEHPGDTGSVSMRTKRVPAERILHLKNVKHLGELRGTTAFASALNRFDDLKEIDESERVASRVAAAMAAYVKKGTPDLYQAPQRDANGQPLKRSIDWVPGMIFDDLVPGEDIATIQSNRPNSALIDFRDSQLRSAAAGVRAGFSSLAKNYDGTFSSQRQELVEQYVLYRWMSSGFTYRSAQPVWDGFVDASTISGAVTVGKNVDRTTLFDCSHSLPPLPWIDPLKEVQALKVEEEQGYRSRSRIIRGRGDNPDQVNREIQRDQQETARLGIELGEKAAANGGTDETQPPTGDRDDSGSRSRRKRR